jgi:heme-degrading monooxygenase HmoA
MIRVIYKWRVIKADIRKFKASWKIATTAIRECAVGARGSLLLQSQEEPDLFITVARWDNYADWQKFWEDSTRTEMKAMHSVAERLSVEVFEEHGDQTI